MEPEKLIQKLASEGTTFLVTCPSPGGIAQLVASPEDVLLLLQDPVAAKAKLNGVSKQEFLGWLSDGFNVYCAATTKKARPCRGIVVGGYHVSATKWVQLQGQYCPAHEDGL